MNRTVKIGLLHKSPTIKFWLNICITILISFSFATLNAYNQTSKAKIGILFADFIIERWHNDRDNFIAKSKELGYEVMVGDAENNQDKQNAQADSMINAGVKLLVVVPEDGYKAAKIVENAHKAGIKVVAYDRLIMNCNLDAYVSYDNEMVGQAMAIYITIRIKQGNFVYIGGPTSDRNSFFVRNGIYQILTPLINNKSINMVCDTSAQQWSKVEAYNITMDIISKNKHPNVIFAASDELAKGVIKCLVDLGLNGKILVTGQDADIDACRNIVNGNQILTLFKPPRLLADRAVQISSGLMGDMPFLTIVNTFNGKVNVPSLILYPVPVDKNNLGNSVIKEGYHSEGDIYNPNK